MKTQEIYNDFTKKVNDLREECPVAENLLMWTIFIASVQSCLNDIKVKIEANLAP